MWHLFRTFFGTYLAGTYPAAPNPSNPIPDDLQTDLPILRYIS